MEWVTDYQNRITTQNCALCGKRFPFDRRGNVQGKGEHPMTGEPTHWSCMGRWWDSATEEQKQEAFFAKDVRWWNNPRTTQDQRDRVIKAKPERWEPVKAAAEAS